MEREDFAYHLKLKATWIAAGIESALQARRADRYGVYALEKGPRTTGETETETESEKDDKKKREPTMEPVKNVSPGETSRMGSSQAAQSGVENLRAFVDENPTNAGVDGMGIPPAAPAEAPRAPKNTTDPPGTAPGVGMPPAATAPAAGPPKKPRAVRPPPALSLIHI